MELTKDKLKIKIYETKKEMGVVAGKEVASAITELLKEQDEVNIVFAAAPSQSELLKYLANNKYVEWGKVNAFHMDEYHTLPIDHKARFGHFLNENIFNHHNFKNVYLMKESEMTTEELIKRYTNLLENNKIDIVIAGVGENGHLAFNDPYVTDFNDKEKVKVIDLDLESRKQQVNDGCYPTLQDVPKSAITLTVPPLMAADKIFCIVPGKQKKNAINKMINDPISNALPATILRKHKDATLFLDNGSYGK